MGLALQPWSLPRDGPVIVALQTPYFFEVRGDNRDSWLADVRRRLALATDRRVIVREKPYKPDPQGFEAVLRGAYAVVARSSNCLVDALLAANQWTVEEMEDGTAWRALRGAYGSR